MVKFLSWSVRLLSVATLLMTLSISESVVVVHVGGGAWGLGGGGKLLESLTSSITIPSMLALLDLRIDSTTLTPPGVAMLVLRCGGERSVASEKNGLIDL